MIRTSSAQFWFAVVFAPVACSGVASVNGLGTVDSEDASTGSSPTRGGRSGAGAVSGGRSAGAIGGGGSLSLSGNSSDDAGCAPGPPWDCHVSRQCPDGRHTTLTGKVYDPAGKVPLYNVIVYVPNDPSTLPYIPLGTESCQTCAALVDGDNVAATVTDNTGSFFLPDVPTGINVPLVLQVGKWRRLLTVPTVADCATTSLPATGPLQPRLPANHWEGDVPRMAVLTGGADDIGCWLTRIGIDPNEYSPPQGGGRVDVYQGLGHRDGAPGDGGPGSAPGFSNRGAAGDCTNTGCPLWANKQSLEKYDVVFLGCEGDTYDPDDPDGPKDGGTANVTPAGKQAMHDWLNEGGTVFATHYHSTWFKNGPTDFQGAATWLGAATGLDTCTGCAVDTTFQKGQVLGQWLVNVGAASGSAISLTGVSTSVSAAAAPTVRWIYDSSNDEPKLLSLQTPIRGDAGPSGPLCGRAIFTDLHAGSAPSGDIPSACSGVDLSPQEKALEFLLFDLPTCIGGSSKPVTIPPLAK